VGRGWLLSAALLAALLAALTTSAAALGPGLHEAQHADGQLYYVYVSAAAARTPDTAPVLAAIHGYSSRLLTDEARARVRRTAERWSALADKQGWVVLAPHFDESRFDNDCCDAAQDRLRIVSVAGGEQLQHVFGQEMVPYELRSLEAEAGGWHLRLADSDTQLRMEWQPAGAPGVYRVHGAGLEGALFVASAQADRYRRVVQPCLECFDEEVCEGE